MAARYWIILFAIGAAFGGSFAFNEILLQSYGGLTVSAARVAFGASGCWVWTIATGRAVRVSMDHIPGLAVFGAFQFTAPFAVLPIAQVHISSSAAGIANAMTPVAVLLISHFWPGGERATLQKLCGAAMGLGGISLLMLKADPDSVSDARYIGIAILAPVSYAIALNLVRKLRGIDLVAMLTWSMTFGAAIAIPLALIVDGAPAHPSLQTLGILVILGVGLTSVTFLVMYSILPTIGATNLSLLTFVAPIFAMMIGIFVLGEVLLPNQLTGAAVIFLALLVIDGRIASRILNRRRLQHSLDRFPPGGTDTCGVE